MKFRSLVLLVLLGLAACTKKPVATTTAYTTTDLETAYSEALAAAKHPTVAKINRDLVALIPETPGLQWDDEGRVLMVTWSKSEYFDYTQGQSFNLYGLTWFTAVPFTKEFCTAFEGEDLRLRLAQYLGMPPSANYDSFVEIWVHPADISRPCPDPEIWDNECQVRIPLVGKGPTPGDTQPPWYCGEEPAEQVGAAFSVVNQNHLTWMCSNWVQSYTQPNLFDNYPWTALGYTYDWGMPDAPFGGSEFIVQGGTQVVYQGKATTASYCGRE